MREPLDANAVLVMAEARGLENLRSEDKRKTKQLNQDLRRNEEVLAEAATFLIAAKKGCLFP